MNGDRDHDTGIPGYPRQDGRVGLRNRLLVVSLVDLANNVCTFIANEVPGSAALLTPAGGLSYGEERSLVERLRARICVNPNVGAVLMIGADDAAAGRLRLEIETSGRPVFYVSLIEAVDQPSAVDLGRKFALDAVEHLNQEPRSPASMASLVVGLKSSTSSVASVSVVNPQIGRVADLIVAAGGTVVATELADLCGAAEQLLSLAGSPEVASRLTGALAEVGEELAALGHEAPDPTPMNRYGGITSLSQKSRASLQRFGTSPIATVFAFGEAVPPGCGLAFMLGPGSSGYSNIGLTAAGCTLILQGTGLTSATAPSPIVPIFKCAGPNLAASTDVDLSLSAENGHSPDLYSELLSSASGQPTAAEQYDSRTITLPAALPRI